MNRERLRTLADFLKTVPPEKFDIREWRVLFHDEHYRDLDIDDFDRGCTDGELKGQCNTAACAVGWACTIPEFNTAGFFFEDTPTLDNGDGDILYAWDAISEFFDISESTATHLFSQHSYHTKLRVLPNAVVNRIEGLID